MREMTIAVDGADLLVGVDGDGPPVVLLHGGLGTHEEMANVAAAIVDDFTVICPDIRGRGRSIDRDAANHVVTRYADDVVAVLDALGFASAAVGGGSLGALTSLTTALRHPERVDALFLLALPMAPGHALTDAQIGMFDAFMAAVPRLIDVAEGREASDGLPEAWRRHDAGSLAAWMGRHLSELVPISSLDELAAVVVPTLVVPGFEAVHPPSIARAYADALPNATFDDCDLGAGERAALAAAYAGDANVDVVVLGPAFARVNEHMATAVAGFLRRTIA